eukprot:m.408174 g.408174  ORF g.408174 m.408174 type:complete len:467 (+) comp20145_c0_seq1:417-1817(+)
MPASGEGGEDLWQSILSGVTSQQAARTQFKPKNLLVLGDEGSGRSTLIDRLRGRKSASTEASLGTGLEYTYIDVQSEDADEIVSRMGVFTLDGNPEHKNLLQFVLNRDSIADLVVMIVVDLSRPWTIAESLQTWTSVLQEQVESLFSDTEADQDILQQLKDKVVKYVAAYQAQSVATEPSPVDNEGAEGEGETLEAGGEPEGETAKADESTVADDDDDDDLLLPLDADVLTVNVGIPIIIVGAKADASTQLEQDRDYRNEHFDFIQMHIRSFALSYGAAVFYCGREAKNKDNLYRYLLHRAYDKDMPFKAQPNIGERDAVLVPSGWDSSTKIGLLSDGFKTIDAADAFEEVIVAPVSRLAAVKSEVEAEDEQEFLKKQQGLLGKPREESESVPRPTAAVARAPASRSSPRLGRRETPAAGAAGAPPAAGAPQQNADVLANFFNSLLSNSRGGAAPGAAPAAQPPAK